MPAVASARALQTFLSSHGVNAALWRTRDGAKSVESLYTELELGETQLGSWATRTTAAPACDACVASPRCA